MEWLTLLKRMSLQEKIGQLVLCGFHGTVVPGELRELIAQGHIGGVILFGRNVASAAQVDRLTQDLQRIAAAAEQVPLWIAIDQEGGMVARLTEDVALMPGNMALAAAGNAEAVYQAARISGLELRALGVNMNYAPVLDVNNNPANPVIGVRSFGETPEAVAALGAEAIRGYQEAGIAATAKHFPGHGDTRLDSHLDLPVVTHDREHLERVELVPFRRAIAAGVDLIMTAHIHFPALEPDRLPATLSKKILTGLLREELGFAGVITTDCMEMNAIAAHYGTVEAAVMAIAAGADLVLISHRHDLQTAVLKALEEAVYSGRIPLVQLDASVARVLRLKAARGVLHPHAHPIMDESTGTGSAVIAFAGVGSAAHRELARRLSEQSITLVRNDAGSVPLKPVPTLAVTVAAAVQTQVDDTIASAGGLGAALAAQGFACIDRTVELNAVAAQIPELLTLASSAAVQQLVVGVYNAAFHPAQLALVQSLQATGKPLVVVALRNPYDLLELGDVQGYVAAYENRPLSLQSTAKALIGLIPFRGTLPVSLGVPYPVGWGLTTG